MGLSPVAVTEESCFLIIAIGKKIVRMFYYQKNRILFQCLDQKHVNDKVKIRESQKFSEKNEIIIASNALCDIIWDHRVKLNWFSGYVIKINENLIKIEHSEHVLANNNLSWRYPNDVDIQEVEHE